MVAGWCGLAAPAEGGGGWYHSSDAPIRQMTLIITAGCPDYILQVSDRRFTWSRSGSVDDEKNKEIVVRSPDGDAVIAFTGLALISGRLMDDWIVDVVRPAAKRGLRAIAEALRTSATAAFEALPSTPSVAPLTFVLAAFTLQSDYPQLVTVSNYENLGFGQSVPTTNFRTVSRSRVKFPYVQDGVTIAIPSAFKPRVRGLLQRGVGYPHLADLIVQGVRAAAEHNSHGKYVGKSCMAICLHKSGQIECVYYAGALGDRTYMPNLVDASLPGDQQISLYGGEFGGGAESMTMGESRGGITILDRRPLSNQEIEDLVARAAALVRIGRYEDALETVQRALALHADHYNALRVQALALHRLERNEEALDVLNRAATLRTDDPEISRLRCAVLLGAGRLDETVEACTIALRLETDHPELLYHRGTARLGLETYEEAIQDFDHAIELRPDHPGTLMNRSNALSALNRHQEALANLDRFLALRPSSANALAMRCFTLTPLNRFVEAVEAGQRANELNPNNHNILYNLACSRALLNQGSAAIDDLRHAIELDPENRRAASEDADFNSIRDDQAFLELVGRPKPSSDPETDAERTGNTQRDTTSG